MCTLPRDTTNLYSGEVSNSADNCSVACISGMLPATRTVNRWVGVIRYASSNRTSSWFVEVGQLVVLTTGHQSDDMRVVIGEYWSPSAGSIRRLYKSLPIDSGVPGGYPGCCSHFDLVMLRLHWVALKEFQSFVENNQDMPAPALFKTDQYLHVLKMQHQI